MSRYLWITAMNRPMTLGTDNNGRTMWAWDIEAEAGGTVEKWEEEIAQVIADAALGVVGTSIFFGPEAPIPTGSGPFIQIADTGGTSPIETHADDLYPRLSAQITVRADNPEAARTRALAIWRVVHGQRDATITAA